MTTGDHSGGMHSRDEILAGEYVLGVLPLEKRREVEQRIQEDRVFAQLVQRWETEFSDFNADYQEETPSAAILARIQERLFGSRAVNTNGTLWNSASFWRWISVATSATAVAAVVYAAFPEQRDGTSPLVADNRQPGQSPRVLRRGIGPNAYRSRGDRKDGRKVTGTVARHGQRQDPLARRFPARHEWRPRHSRRHAWQYKGRYDFRDQCRTIRWFTDRSGNRSGHCCRHRPVGLMPRWAVSSHGIVMLPLEKKDAIPCPAWCRTQDWQG